MVRAQSKIKQNGEEIYFSAIALGSWYYLRNTWFAFNYLSKKTGRRSESFQQCLTFCFFIDQSISNAHIIQCVYNSLM